VSKPKARYRAGIPPHTASAGRPRHRWRRLLILAVAIVIYAALLWYYVFPYVDQHFVNQPTI